MISSLILLSASVVATPVFISEVKATREAGHLRVEVLGDGGIDPEGARTKIDDGILLIYLEGTRVRADNRSWELSEGAGEIRAHRHKKETELVVPLAGNGCAGPVELTGTKTGITALVGCEGTVTTVRGNRLPVLGLKNKVKLVPSDNKLKALVEIPVAPDPGEAREARPAVAAPVAVKAVDAPTPRVASSSVVVPKAAPVAPTLSAAASSAASAAASAAVSPIVPAATSAGMRDDAAVGSLRAVALPASLLGVLALCAYLFARRRRAVMPRRIEILETASLGPKRSLIVARVGDETLILGSSEAGITLLRGGSPHTDVSAAIGRVVAASDPASDDTMEISQPIEEALADIPEPDAPAPRMTHRGGFRAIEGGLAGLFSRRSNDVGGDAGMGQPDRFEDLLEDSVEDQELRRKLAAGMSARVR